MGTILEMEPALSYLVAVLAVLLKLVLLEGLVRSNSDGKGCLTLADPNLDPLAGFGAGLIAHLVGRRVGILLPVCLEHSVLARRTLNDLTHLDELVHRLAWCESEIRVGLGLGSGFFWGWW